jgi:hypothetical protein
MTISHVTSKKQLTLYPPAKPNIDLETPLWDDKEYSDEEGESHQVLSIDQYLTIREKIEDDYFMTYGNEFDEALSNIGKTLIRCKESNIALNNEKCAMMLTDGIVLGHHISAKVIPMGLTKIKVILNFPTTSS